jgi:hypothetical protein
MASPYRCLTPCDGDCEIQGWGCHERHAYDKDHDPEACEALTLAGNLAWLLAVGWLVRFGHYTDRPQFSVCLANPHRNMRIIDAATPGEAAAKAVEWSQGEGFTP